MAAKRKCATRRLAACDAQRMLIGRFQQLRPRAWDRPDQMERKIVGKFSHVFLITAALAVMTGEAGAQGRPTRFWNLTRNTISEFRLAPAGTSDWGPDQCKNDKDGTVEPDERLRITDVRPGRYDAKLADVTGRVCVVHGIEIEAGAIFSIEEKELTSCFH